MKQVIIFISIAFTSFISCTSSDSRVYICTGAYSRAYHKTSDCMGLIRCSGDIEEITKSETIDEGRHKCGFCY